ncbi:hypothetical protein llap_11907 [Limosa lapponica baueri]|uniref:Uncharacterized protein n=1 Tax=Limosa lapponica baueri TaxID=1758121 RepID=A0A2I0TVI1_LIMLA|nr:hypothetical protein llap_11907 [Limosa lapponica baueri]
MPGPGGTLRAQRLAELAQSPLAKPDLNLKARSSGRPKSVVATGRVIVSRFDIFSEDKINKAGASLDLRQPKSLGMAGQ